MDEHDHQTVALAARQKPMQGVTAPRDALGLALEYVSRVDLDDIARDQPQLRLSGPRIVLDDRAAAQKVGDAFTAITGQHKLAQTLLVARLQGDGVAHD